VINFHANQIYLHLVVVLKKANEISDSNNNFENTSVTAVNSKGALDTFHHSYQCSQVRYWWALSGRSWLSEFRPLSQLSHKMGGKFRLNNWPNIMWSLWCSITLMLAPCEYCSGNQTSHNKCYAYLTTIAWCYTICVRPSWHTILLWPLLASAPHSHNTTTILYMTAYHSLLWSCSLATNASDTTGKD
jgi:hypothetical protein